MTRERREELREEYNEYMANRIDEGLEAEDSDYDFEDYLEDFYSEELAQFQIEETK